jgi:hypothetical protein
MLDGYKTFFIAVLILVGTAILIAMKILPNTAWAEAVQWSAIMIGARELADKGIGKLLNKPSTPAGVNVTPGG